jgi:hypothetical protein
MTNRMLVLVVAAAVTATAQSKREGHAHEHGKAKLGIAFEGSNGKVEWEAPLESITGFEHEAKTPADKKRLEEAKAVVRARFGEMVRMPATAGCKVTVDDTHVDQEGSHRDLHTKATIACLRAPAGEIRFDFARFFPRIEKTEVQFLSGEKQLGGEVTAARPVLRIE